MSHLLDAQRPQPRLCLRETGYAACINEDSFASGFDDPNVTYIGVFTAGDAAPLENRQTGHDLGRWLRQAGRLRRVNDTAPTQLPVLLDAHQPSVRCPHHGESAILTPCQSRGPARI